MKSPFSLKTRHDGKCETRPSGWLNVILLLWNRIHILQTIAKDKWLQKVAKQDYEYIKLLQHISSGVKIMPLVKVPETVTPPVRWQFSGNAEKLFIHCSGEVLSNLVFPQKKYPFWRHFLCFICCTVQTSCLQSAWCHNISKINLFFKPRISFY